MICNHETTRHVVVSPHPSLPGPDWSCLWYESTYPTITIYARTYASADIYCRQLAKICTRSALASTVRAMCFSTVRCWLLQCSLLVHVYWHHLVGCCCVIGRHLWVLLLPPHPPSHDGALAGGSWQHPPRRCYGRGLVHGNILHDGSCVGGINMNANKINTNGYNIWLHRSLPLSRRHWFGGVFDEGTSTSSPEWYIFCNIILTRVWFDATYCWWK